MRRGEMGIFIVSPWILFANQTSCYRLTKVTCGLWCAKSLTDLQRNKQQGKWMGLSLGSIAWGSVTENKLLPKTVGKLLTRVTSWFCNLNERMWTWNIHWPKLYYLSFISQIILFSYFDGTCCKRLTLFFVFNNISSHHHIFTHHILLIYFIALIFQMCSGAVITTEKYWGCCKMVL